MQDWTKRLNGMTETGRKTGRKLGERAVEAGSRWGKELGGKWLPKGMQGVASGLAGASKALDSGAKRLRKTVKSVSLHPQPALQPAMQPIPVNRRHTR